MTLIQRLINVDATSYHCIDVDATLLAAYDAYTTSRQRRYNVTSTLMRRCLNVMCSSSTYFFHNIIFVNISRVERKTMVTQTYF